VEGRVDGRPGGSWRLLDLVDEHQEAVEFELLRAGFRLRDVGSEQLDWRDFYVLVRGWVNVPHNEVARSARGHDLWTVEEQLLAIAADRLAHANWQRAGRRVAPPKPLPRPWDKKKSRQLGRDAIPISQFDDWWESQARR